MTERRNPTWLNAFDLAGAACALFAAAQPAIYQIRISYREPTDLFGLWFWTVLVALAVRFVRSLCESRHGLLKDDSATRFDSFDLLQLTTLTATSTLAVHLLAPYDTIQTTSVHPTFRWIYLVLHFLGVTWISFGGNLRGIRAALLLVMLSGLNGRLFNADFSTLLPLALSCLIRLIGRSEVGGAPFRLGAFERGMALLWVIAAIGTPFAPQADVAYSGLIRFGFFVLLALVVARHCRELSAARRFLIAQLVVGVLIASFTLLIIALAARYATPRAVLNTRFQLFNAHPNLVGPQHAVNAVLALGFGLYLCGAGVGRTIVQSRLRKLAALAAVALFTGVLIQGASKAALGAFVFGSVLLILFGRFEAGRSVRNTLVRLARNRTVLTLVILVPLIIGALFAFGPRGMRDRFTSSGIRQTLEYRLDIWQATTEVIAAHPFLGVGIENYALAGARLKSVTAQDETRDPHPHNLYLAVMQATGLPGAMCFLVALIALFSAAIRVHHRSEDPYERRFLVTACSAIALILAASLLDVGLGLGTFLPPSLLILGAMVSGYSTERLAAIATNPNEVRSEGTMTGRMATGLAFVILLALTLRPALAAREVYAARIDLRAGRSKSAAEHYDRASKLDPFDPKISLAQIDLLRGASTLPEERKRNLNTALDILRGLSKRQPYDASLLVRMAQIHRDLREVDDAIAAIRLAIERAPRRANSAPYYVELGILLWAGVKDLDGTFDAFKNAIVLDLSMVNHIPWKKEPRGNGYDDQRVVVEGTTRTFALEDIIGSIRSDLEAELERTGTPDILEWLKLFHMYFNAGDFAEAEQIIERIGAFPNYHLVTVARERADIALRAGDLDAAIERYREALAARPNFGMYLNIADAYIRKGEFELARSFLDASRSLKEDLVASADWYAKLYRKLAEVDAKLGNSALVLGWLEHARFFTPNPADRLQILSQLAAAQRSAGMRDAALRTIDEAAEVLILAGIDIVQQGIDNVVRDLACLAVTICDPNTPEGRARLLSLSDPVRARAASPAFSVFAAWCRLGADDLDGAQEMLLRSRSENPMNRLADLAAIDVLIASGRRQNVDKVFVSLGETDTATGYRSIRESRLRSRYDSKRGTEGAPRELKLEIADHYFVAGVLAEAAKFYKELSQSKDDDAIADGRLARTLFLLGDSATAAALFRRAAKNAPTDPFYPLLARGASL